MEDASGGMTAKPAFCGLDCGGRDGRWDGSTYGALGLGDGRDGLGDEGAWGAKRTEKRRADATSPQKPARRWQRSRQVLPAQER
jgi:hypothetical protein